MFGKKIEELCPDEEAINSALATAKKQLDEFIGNFTQKGGPYFYGKGITYLDMVIASIFMWVKIIADEELWSQAKEWDEGRWKRLLDNFEEKGYTTVY